MSGYQVTGWLAWQHHMALVLMASLYLLNIKLQEQDEIPLLSVRDARLLVIAINFATQKKSIYAWSIFELDTGKDKQI